MRVKDIATKISVFLNMPEKTQFPGFMFPKVVQKH